MHLIHIGTGKTGSTAIQKALANSILGDPYVYYQFDDYHHNLLEVAIKDIESWHRVNVKKYKNSSSIAIAKAKKLSTLMKEGNERGMVNIVSSEYLFSLSMDEINNFLNLLGCSSNNIKVIVYIRQPSKYVLSAIQQFVKHDWNMIGEVVKKICEEQLKGKYSIEVIDLLKNPQLGAADQIFALPTLVRKLPVPVRKIIGDLSNTDRVLIGLDLLHAD